MMRTYRFEARRSVLPGDQIQGVAASPITIRAAVRCADACEAADAVLELCDVRPGVWIICRRRWFGRSFWTAYDNRGFHLPADGPRIEGLPDVFRF